MYISGGLSFSIFCSNIEDGREQNGAYNSN